MRSSRSRWVGTGRRTKRSAATLLASQLGFFAAATGGHRPVHLHFRRRRRLLHHRAEHPGRRRQPRRPVLGSADRTRFRVLPEHPAGHGNHRGRRQRTCSRPAPSCATEPSTARPSTSWSTPETPTTRRQAASGRTRWHNPKFPAKCGIDVAILHDLSNSVEAPDLTAMKAASTSFVDALVGTPSQVGTFTFASLAPASRGRATPRSGSRRSPLRPGPRRSTPASTA